MFTTVVRGYRLQFAAKPPSFNGVLFSEATGEATEALESEISSLLSRGAIYIVPGEERSLSLYSRYFLVPKKQGSLRPVLDIRFLNSNLRKYKFRMLTHNFLFHWIQPGEVHISGSAGCLFSHKHICSAQNISQVCLQISDLSIRAVTRPEGLQQVCGSSFESNTILYTPSREQVE